MGLTGATLYSVVTGNPPPRQTVSDKCEIGAFPACKEEGWEAREVAEYGLKVCVPSEI